MIPEIPDYVASLNAQSTVLEAELRQARIKREMLKLDGSILVLRFFALVCMAIGFGIGWAVCSAMT